MTIQINVVEWVLYLVVVWLSLVIANTTLTLLKKYFDWRLKVYKKRLENKFNNKFKEQNMAYISVDVDVDIEDYLDEVSTRDLIEELNCRDLSDSQKLDMVGYNAEPRKMSLMDDLKVEVIMDNLESKTLNEIEEFFKK